MWFWIIILWSTSKAPVPLRYALIAMASIVGVLLPIVLFVPSEHHSRLFGVFYTMGSALLFGVVMFYGPRVRCNLGLWYPQQMKRYEQIEKWSLWVLLGYMMVASLRSSP